MLLRRRLAAFATIVAAVALAAPPSAGAAGGHNHVTVVNQVDGRATGRASSAVVVGHDATVGEENTAFARAQCTDCRTMAVAVQVVAIEGDVSDFRPLNAAVALNLECTRCQTYAYARQEIVAVDGAFALSDAGRDEVWRLESAIERLANSDEPFAEIGAQLDALTVQLREVVRTEIGRAGRRELGRAANRAVDVAA